MHRTPTLIRPYILTALCSVPLLASTCTDASTVQAAPETGENGSPNKPERAFPVTTHILEPRAVAEKIPCTGNVEAFHTVEVVSRANGQLLDVAIEEGQTVTKGQVLFSIDDRHQRLSLEVASNRQKDASSRVKEARFALQEAKDRIVQADLEHRQANRALARTKKSHEEDLASATALEDSQLACDKCKSALDLAKTAEKKAKLGLELAANEAERAVIDHKIQDRLLEDYTVRAPITGVVSVLAVKGGEQIAIQSPVCTIVASDDLVLYLKRPQQELSQLKVDQKVEIEVDAFEEHFKGHIDLISPTVDATTGTFRARVRVADAERRLRPGMFCRARIITGTSHHALMIPKAAILYEADRPFAYVVRNNTAVRIPIERGIELTTSLEATNTAKTPKSGMFVAGDRIVIEGSKKLEPGRQVQVKQ